MVTKDMGRFPCLLRRADAAVNGRTDDQMRGLHTSVDLAQKVAARFPEAEIIVASGRVRPDEIELPQSNGFLTKPYDFDHIVKRFKVLL